MASGSTLSENTQQNFLECGICLQKFQDPRGLPCLHAFCCECLRKWVRASGNRSIIICPVCKKKADVPGGDVGGFPSHFMVKNLLDTFHKESVNKKSNHGRYCKVHNEAVRYYCKNERKLVCPDCVSERKCHIDHDRISFKDMHRQTGHISELKQECEKVKIKYEDELKKTTKVEKEFLSATQEIQKVKQNLTSTLSKIDTACGSSINQASSTYDVIDTMGLLLQVVCPCSRSPPSVADSLSLDQFKLDMRGPKQPATMLEEWKLTRRLNLPVQFEPQSLAINQFGDIAVSSTKYGVAVLSRTGQVKCYLTNCRSHTIDITVTRNNTFIVPGNTKLLCYKSNGKQFSTIDVANDWTHTLAVDKCGRIIGYAGYGQARRWFIRSPTGEFLHSFSTDKEDPFRLEGTYTGDIVFSQYDAESQRCTGVKLMDYFGDDVRDVKPPPKVTSWVPTDVCCSKQQSEIYVVNGGQPKGIYQFTAQGDYVGCVTTDIRYPTGIALSPDEKELFAVDRDHQVVIIFQRK